MSRRDLIRMTDDEVTQYLDGRHTLNVATIGPSGRIHLVAMWYGFLDSDVAFWTYGKSQKIKNLERDTRMTCLIETGDTYDQLKGVELVGTGEIIRDPEVVQRLGENVHERYNGPIDDRARQAVAVMGAKRAVVRMHVDSVVSWDHTTLGGTY